MGVKPWQIQQAADAGHIYRYQYRRANEEGEGGSALGGLSHDAAMLARLREVIRLRHYAKSTEKTYLHWTRRFLAYRQRSGCEDGPTTADVKALLIVNNPRDPADAPSDRTEGACGLRGSPPSV